ncbi:MAG: GTPase domain-containing protein [Planctomycetes bacterium]|nr:GTPase domain-containing protein [Planctomycetota bacterium]
MVQINFAMKEVNCKVVYYGPGMSGKTTNLEIVHKKAPEQHRGELTSISTDGDRTLFFDFMPLDLGTIAGMRTKFQLYTVPGQVYYNSTRKLVLQGVDGVIFVADSDPSKMQENLESLANLEENLREYGKELKNLPHVLQWNKRDLPGAAPLAELQAKLNRYGAPSFEAVARTGEGVFPTLKALAASVLESLNRRDQAPAAAARTAAALPAQQAAPAPALAAASSGAAYSSAAPAAESPTGFIPGAGFPSAAVSAAPSRSAPPPPPRPAVAAPPAAKPAPNRPPSGSYGAPAPAPQMAAARPATPVRPAVRPAPAAAPVPVVQDYSSQEPRSSNKAVIAGVLLGALGALALLGVAFLFFFR